MFQIQLLIVQFSLLVTSPIFIIGSFNDVFVELTVVVVPSTCKLPLMITIPSLSKPSGYGSMNMVFPPPDLLLMTLDEIPMLSTIKPSQQYRFTISRGTPLYTLTICTSYLNFICSIFIIFNTCIFIHVQMLI